MPKPNFRTWVPGEIVTAAQLNEQIRDAGNAMWPYTTKGDIAVATTSNTIVRLPVGANGKVLRANSAATAGVEWLGLPIITGISNNISTNTNSTSFIDVPNSSLTLTLPYTSTVYLFACGTASSAGSSDGIELRSFIGATGGQNQIVRINVANGSVPVFMMQRIASVAAGNITMKLQYKSIFGAQANFYNANVYGVAIAL